MIKSTYVKELCEIESANYSPYDNEDDKKALINPSIREESNQYLKEKIERLYWIDCLRILANILVVFIDCTAEDLKPVEFKSYNWYTLFFYNSLSRACVPLFIMISGILFLDVEKPLTIKKLYTKYIFRIFRCLVFWSIYYTFFDKFVINFNQENYNFDYETIKDTVVKSIYNNGHLWYLNFIIGVYMVTPIFRGIAYNNNEIKYIFWLFITISSIIPTTSNFIETFFSIKLTIIVDFINSLRINSARGFTFYYLWGYLLAYSDREGKKYKILSYIIGALGIVLTVILRIFSSVYLGKENNLFGEYNCVNVAMTAYGIFIFFKFTINDYIEKFNDESVIKKCILSLSNCTLGIYLIHMTIHHLLYRFANFNPQSFNPLFCAPLFSVVVYILSFIIIFVFRKIVPYFEYIC